MCLGFRVSDDLYHWSAVHQYYSKAAPDYTGSVTVLVLWDKQQQTIVSNESAEIIRMFNSAFKCNLRALRDYPHLSAYLKAF